MKVYIEIVVLDNFVMTAAIAIMSYYILGVRIAKIRVLIASTMGTLISVFYPFLPIDGWLLALTKIAVGISLALVLFIKKANTFKGTAAFFLMTAVSGGICVFVNYLLVGSFYLSLVTAPVLPYSVPTAIVLVVMLIAKIIWNKSRANRIRRQFSCSVMLTVFGCSYGLSGFLDSGNTLFDEISGLPVIVVKLSAIKCKLDDRTLVLLLSGDGQKIKGVRYINASGLGGTEKLPIVRAEKIVLYSDKKMNTNRSVMVGIAINNFGGDADVLLHPSIIGG